MSSTDRFDISPEQGKLLAKLARQAIAYRLETGKDLPPASKLPEPLSKPGAAFVSLHKGEDLRGCIGSLLAKKPLVETTMEAAVDAALNDPRFEPVSREELDILTVKTSVLSDAEPIQAANDQELIEQLRPGEDGLILHDGKRRATFLPAVWENLPDPYEFLANLKAKAGLMPDHWSPTLHFARYTSITFSDEGATHPSD
ncbi:AmmeMemoRadiSam system protein A [Halorhodospira halochloris]|uniref:AmmeMemoRadiSam system protein A n=1 Tax=Halorhodospira halochloris TaxID=1052 RepID=UPI001EE8D142|nr:AmmeMemoRadiSam system protein A [Halorhodospira halochloris]MCG5529831.1 AmmeMemoRadiSam system protein A [Halorhodospira halochloris]